MGVLGKDLFDIHRPRTHVKVQFGTEGYWVEDDPTMIPYGAALTALLNYGSGDTGALHNRIVRLYFSEGEDVTAIRERYAWFLEDAFPPVFEKKKGQRKKPLAQRIYERGLDALVSGVSLGKSPEVDAPHVNIQYAVLEIDEAHHELVEKLYFDRLADFVYVELMRGLQRGFVPKRCANCGRWFLQTPGASYNYCDQPAPNSEEDKTCREVGSTKSFRAKVLNHPIWAIHQRAYKKYFARTKKGTMSKAEFEAWGREAERLRDEALAEYDRARTEEEKAAIVERLREELNRD